MDDIRLHINFCVYKKKTILFLIVLKNVQGSRKMRKDMFHKLSIDLGKLRLIKS